MVGVQYVHYIWSYRWSHDRCSNMYKYVPSVYMGGASRGNVVCMKWNEISLRPVMYGSSVFSVNVSLCYPTICPRGCGGPAVLYIEQCSHRSMARGRVNGTLRLLQPNHVAMFANYFLRLNDDGYDCDYYEHGIVAVVMIMRISNHLFSIKTMLYP